MDRRHHARSSPPGLAFVKIEPGMGGTMVDVCEGGLGFRVIMPLVENSGPVKVSFSLDAASLLEAGGEVAWADPSGRSGGVRFINIHDDVRRQLREFLDKNIAPIETANSADSASLPFLGAFTTRSIPQAGPAAGSASNAAQKSVSAPIAAKSVPAVTSPKVNAPRPKVVAPGTNPPQMPAGSTQAAPESNALSVPPGSSPARRPVPTKNPPASPVFMPPTRERPWAAAPPQASSSGPTVAEKTPELESAHSFATQQNPGESSPGYEPPQQYAASTSFGSPIASDMLLGKVKQIRPSSRVAPPARPIRAQEPPDAPGRAAVNGSNNGPNSGSKGAPSSGNGVRARVADVTLIPPPAYGGAAALGRPAVEGPTGGVSAAGEPPAMPRPAPLGLEPFASSAAETMSAPAAPVTPETLPPLPAEAPASAETEWSWRSVIAQPAAQLSRFQIPAKLRAHIPEELRNPQFVGRTVGAGVVTAFLALLLLTTYNYFKEARAASGIVASQTAPAPQPPAQSVVNTFPAYSSPSTRKRVSDRTGATRYATGRDRFHDSLPGPEDVHADTTGNADLLVARHYLSEQSDDQNQALAIQWLWSAVGKGNAQADIVLSDMYLRGQGVTQNCEQSKVLLRAAVNTGSSEAQRKLTTLDQRGCPANTAQNQ